MGWSFLAATQRVAARITIAACALVAVATVAAAQTAPIPDKLEPESAAVAATPVPEALPEAPPNQRYPKPGQPAPVLTSGDKVRMALHGSFSTFAATGWLSAALYEQLTNTSPNWGTDRGAFGQRLGDAAIRATTEDFLSDGIMAPLLREDPRYYRLGRGHKPLARAVYAITRPLITRTDSGRTVPNFALMSGNLAGSALTDAYYPRANRGFAQTIETFGGGLGGSALGDGIIEFFGGILIDHNFHAAH
jgi:hypothetical protein